MATLYGANVTKFNAGGSGDNIISDGYIKTVEKIWMDSYTLTAAVSTADTIVLATLPPNKKITDIRIYVPGKAVSNTTSTIMIATDTNAAYNLMRPVLLDDVAANSATGGTLAGWTIPGISSTTQCPMDGDNGFQYVTTGSTNTKIVASIGVTATAATGGTIKWIIRYT